MTPLGHVMVEHYKGLPVARVQGEIDTSNIDEIGTALSTAAADPGPGLIIDLSAVTYLNSATIKCLFDLADLMRQRQQQLRLVAADRAPMRHLLHLVKVESVIPLHATIAQAAAHFLAQRLSGEDPPPRSDG